MQAVRAVSVSLALVSLSFLFTPLQAQERVLALGSYDFYHYYEYEELTSFLQDIHEAFPRLTTLESPAASTSRWVTTPINVPSALSTGICLMWCSAINLRALARVSSGPRV